MGLLTCAWAAKIQQWNHCSVNAAETTAQGKGLEPPQATIPNKQFKLTGEPQYRGKGKRSGLLYNHCDIVSPVHDHAGGHRRPGKMNDTPLTGNPGMRTYAGLDHLILASNSVVLGEDKMQMRRKNKQQQQALRAEQPLICTWTQYQGMMETLSPTNHATCPPVKIPCAQQGMHFNTLLPTCCKNRPHLGAL